MITIGIRLFVIGNRGTVVDAIRDAIAIVIDLVRETATLTGRNLVRVGWTAVGAVGSPVAISIDPIVCSGTKVARISHAVTILVPFTDIQYAIVIAVAGVELAHIRNAVEIAIG